MTIRFLLLALATPLILAGTTLVQQAGSAVHLDACMADSAHLSSTLDSCATTEIHDRQIGEAPPELSSPATAAVHDSGEDLGVAQSTDIYRANDILQVLASGREYMHQIREDPQYAKVVGMCRNQHTSCAFWASLGECDSNPGYMRTNCAPVCQTCDLLHVETRCPMDPNAVDALYPGDLDRMFERILVEHADMEPRVVSRPTLAEGDSPSDYLVGGPWMVVFENAMSDEEADRLIELGGLAGYERSEDVGSMRADGTFTSDRNEGRTSTNAWCTGDCYRDPVARRVIDRISNVTGIADENSEYLQLLRYEKNQFYQQHSDYIPHQKDRPCGVRILTFYFYLSDVEEGGGTHFPKLHLTVTPKKGRAVLWPSVFNQHPNIKDPRSDHEAQPVIRGVKYGANAWIHQRDFKSKHDLGCS